VKRTAVIVIPKPVAITKNVAWSWSTNPLSTAIITRRKRGREINKQVA
jgi:hypothetical protein